MTNAIGKSFWIRNTLSGGTEFHTSSKVLFVMLLLLLAVLLYPLLIAIEGLEGGAEIIVILAYGVGVLLVMLILLMLIISLIEYLHTFE